MNWLGAGLIGAALVAVPALAQGDADMRLADMARPWLAAENPDGLPAQIDATVSCVMAVLSPLPAALKDEMLAQEDFEDALDAAVSADPTLERPLEACF